VSSLVEPSPAHWKASGRGLVAKLLAELAYEEVLAPVPTGDGYTVAFGAGRAYSFAATRDRFGGWRVDADSVSRHDGPGREPADDPVQLALDARAHLALAGGELGDVVRDLLATQRAEALRIATAPTATELADLGYVELESRQAGHPCIALNRGRLGFAASDMARYAPEAARPLRLQWIAVDPRLGRHHGVRRDDLLAAQLDRSTRERFASRLERQGGDRATWTWLPVHPFHLDEAIAPLFAAEVATGRMVLLGEGPDRHRPLQSVRTVANVDAPLRHDVKLPLAIRNTLVWRGLALAPSAAAPRLTAWLKAISRSDPFLSGPARMVILGEVASVTVEHPRLAGVAEFPYRYHELLGAVWREPVTSFLGSGERARTMASLLGVGRDGRALVAELVARSGLDPRCWLRRLLEALLPPLLHWLYAHGVAFCPHGENTVLIFDSRDVPVGIAIKDLAEDVNLLPRDRREYPGLPPEADGVLLRWPERELCHSILSAIFAGHFRFFGDMVERHLGVTEDEFWTLVGETVRGYQGRFPQLADAFERFELHTPEFERVCLNREQLLGDGFHDRSERDETFDLVNGMVPNPLAGQLVGP
jgi:siderophore synthetase component